MKFNFIKKNRLGNGANQKGFTLIETMVAIGIFAASITGLIAITAGGVSNANFVKNKFTAAYLALEGQELVHNIRDSSTNAEGPWVNEALAMCIESTVQDGRGCMIDAWDTAGGLPVAVACAEDCDFLNYNEDDGHFSYVVTGGVNSLTSIFRRTIFIEPIGPNPDQELVVTSKVEWMQGTRPHNVTYTSYLLNWTSSD